MTPQYQDWYNQRIADLEGLYAPEIAGIQQQIEQLPQMYEAQKSSLQQAKENAFRDITKTAARGGMFFTGFTPREQARYLGERYLPGLQQLGQQELTAKTGLLNQITGLRSKQRAEGLNYLDKLRGYQRADELAAKAAAAKGTGGGFSLPNLNLPTETPATTSIVPKIVPPSQSNGKGFQFFDALGNPINAAQYVALYQAAGGQLGYRELLSRMAAEGDVNAQIALNYVGNDAQFGSAPEQYRASLEALGATGTYAKGSGQADWIQQYNKDPKGYIEKSNKYNSTSSANNYLKQWSKK